jgi:hypothetical protein
LRDGMRSVWTCHRSMNSVKLVRNGSLSWLPMRLLRWGWRWCFYSGEHGIIGITLYMGRAKHLCRYRYPFYRTICHHSRMTTWSWVDSKGKAFCTQAKAWRALVFMIKMVTSTSCCGFGKRQCRMRRSFQGTMLSSSHLRWSRIFHMIDLKLSTLLWKCRVRWS